VDQDRVARLQWLLASLAEILPKRADGILSDWRRLRRERETGQREGGGSPSLLSKPERLERWERSMADSLLIFLEPRLPAPPDTEAPVS
jgi:hypothetical protein